MKAGIKKALYVGGAGLGSAVLVAALYGWQQTSTFDASLAKVYDLPLPTVSRSSDPAVLLRGKHLSESVTACSARDCHGSDLGGGKTLELGPLGTLSGPNISTGGITVAYSDGELLRLLRHGIKRDGHGVLFMPVQDFRWLPDSDLVALISYLRTVPAVARPNGPLLVKPLAKILDRRETLVFDIARRVAGAPLETPPAPAPTAEYGRFLARLCTGCHGEGLSGGRIPGAPPSLPTPTNITQHESGIKDWGFADFEKLLTTGIRKNGRPLDPFMPYDTLARLDDTEKQALWNYLRTVPPRPFGQR